MVLTNVLEYLYRRNTESPGYTKALSIVRVLHKVIQSVPTAFNCLKKVPKYT